MFNNEADFQKTVDRLKIDDKPNPAHLENLRSQMFTVFDRARWQQEIAHATVVQTLWRTIMKSPFTKKAAAAAIIAGVLIGIYQFGGGRVALAQTTKALRFTLSQLKTMVLENKARSGDVDTPPAQQIPEIDASTEAGQGPRIDGKAIQANAEVFQIRAGGQEKLTAFLESQDINFSPTASNPDVSFVVLDSDKLEHLTAFVESTNVLGLSGASVLHFLEGHEAVIASGDFGFALSGTVREDDEKVNLSLIFHDGQAGFETPSITVGVDQAVLMRCTERNDEGEGDVLILVQVEVN